MVIKLFIVPFQEWVFLFRFPESGLVSIWTGRVNQELGPLNQS